MSTVPTEVDEIRREMAEIRRSMHEDVRGVVATAEAAADWHRYLMAYPWITVGVAFAAGYLIVPRRAKEVVTVADLSSKVQQAVDANSDRMLQATGAEAQSTRSRTKGIIGTAIGILMPLALKTAQGYALKYAEQWFLDQQFLHQHAGPAPAAAEYHGGPGARPTRPAGPGSSLG